MYATLKKIAKGIFPAHFINQVKPIGRYLVYFFYNGNQFRCLICDANLSTFIHLPNKDLLCPKCGSLPRTRRLMELLVGNNLLKGKVLHFSPPFCLYQKLKFIPSIRYLSSDFEKEFIADKKYDITNIEEKEETFDLVIAYHVLEHIEADLLAMQELFRILKKGGKAIIQTPFKEGEIYEDSNIVTPANRLKHFGQADHVRIYSIIGLKNRLQSVGFEVQVLNFKSEINNFYGFKTIETVLLAKK